MAQNLIYFTERENKQKQPAMPDSVAQLMTVLTRQQVQTPPTGAADTVTAAGAATHHTATAGYLASATDR